MTCIVGLVDKKRVWMGVDSLGVAGGSPPEGLTLSGAHAQHGMANSPAPGEALHPFLKPLRGGHRHPRRHSTSWRVS